MAIFESVLDDQGHLRKYRLLDYLIVGGKGSRAVDRKGLDLIASKDGWQITLATMEYDSKDAMCCPSISSRAHFFLGFRAGSRLTEIDKKE